MASQPILPDEIPLGIGLDTGENSGEGSQATTLPVASTSSTQDPKDIIKRNPTLTHMPDEVLKNIFRLLDPIDVTCLSLASKVLYKIPPKLEDADFPSDMDAKSAFHTYPGVPLLTGSPFSSTPVERHMSLSGCLHCTPGQYYPSHCELHFHLRSWMPEHLRFCKAPCNRFTSSRARRVKLEFLELTGYTESQIKAGSSVLLDSVPTLHGGHYAVPKNCSVIGRHTDPAEGFCGTCGVSYRKQYENGRMRLSPYTEDGVKMPQYYNWRTMMNK